ncbi:MAG: SDR family oxidoreductase [Burkholderiales bacterium]|jgi:citronellol/citronellal dehydrogenase|uniref:SDR family oxidoreductase n=1 Tax=unclassified Polaromonas TaxID=2638319 RepID=UPI000BBBC4EF|nr:MULTISPECIES: SDR family oxidoreductase [unclassified Polaromonas]MBX9611189.1 SDR family oxidoreductase [Burkholderiales bacterium]MDI1274790.1 SDR family oxidoreductase [Polaromonas sp.]MDP2451761.1 SDR family oxidoreductase [Polaromonas sp.]
MSQPTYRSVFRPGLFAGQTVIVTGGGSGIGRCTAHELANLGASVALVGRRVEKLEAVQTEITQAGGQASIHACDIRDEPGVKAMIADVIARHGKIDGLVNNAGGQYPQPVKDISLKGWDAVVRSNLTGGFLVAREAFNQSMASNGGAIVNIIADIWGGMPTMAHSGAARAGMLSFTETAACEWACAGVRVNAVAPGWIASSGFDTYSPEMQAELRSLKTKVPLQRYGTEAEISAAIVFLLCEAAAFITGSCIRVDGGVPNARPTWKLQAHDRSKPFNGFALAEPPKCLSVKDQ